MTFVEIVFSRPWQPVGVGPRAAGIVTPALSGLGLITNPLSSQAQRGTCPVAQRPLATLGVTVGFSMTGAQMKTYAIAANPGDGIGTEVISAGVEVLQALAKREGGFEFKVEQFDWGGEYYKKHGRMMPANGRDLIKHDAILFGSAGHPTSPTTSRYGACASTSASRSTSTPTSGLRACCPASPAVAPRERQGARLGDRAREHGGRVCRRRRPRPSGSPLEAATEVAMFTRAGVERIMRFAFELAQSRPRKLLTVVTKSNAQRHAMVMWDEIAVEVAAEFPDVTWDKMLVDAMTMRMVIKPQSIDTWWRPTCTPTSCPISPLPLRDPRHRADREPESRAQVPIDVRADPRLGVRHHRQGHRQSRRHLLVGRHDARSPRRAAAAPA